MNSSISNQQSSISNCIDIGAAVDASPSGGYQRWVVFLTALTIIFDGIDNQLLGIVIPTLMREWGVPRSAFAPLV
jgi:MFS transporter, AAHS family, 4-hydroxybenzoate transporter